MNCREGDMAIVVRCDRGDEWALGTPLRLTKPAKPSAKWGPMWHFEPEPKMEAHLVVAISDWALMPIGGPMVDQETLVDEPVAA